MEEAWGGTGAWRGVTDKEIRYGREEVGAVSYTHLTLPTIYSV